MYFVVYFFTRLTGAEDNVSAIIKYCNHAYIA